MRYLIALAALMATIALAAAGTAAAGGWATVGFTPLPDDTAAGGTWKPKITILQHGVTPLEGLRPTVTIDDVDTGASQQFTAAATSEPGIYEADVVFPTDGRWRVTIDSTFGDSRVTYGPFVIDGRPAGAPGGEIPVARVLGLAGALALAAAAAFVVVRQRRLRPAA
jgi:YtkA-like